MPRRIAVNSLNASTIDILNTIRINASREYQQYVPVITSVNDIPKVGEVLYGYPALANQFISSLVNRIASVRIKSAVFNNAYAELKKGYLEFGETVEEVFVNIAKAREFMADNQRPQNREFARTLPDVRTAFHAINWRVQYPITIQDEDLRMAFQNAEGVQDLIARIVDSIYTAAEYDEFLLFKYLIIKGIAKGKFYPVALTVVANDTPATMKNAAVQFRAVSNKMQFINTQYNEAGVHTATPRADQYIFMDSTYNAQFDVDVLASAFNMDKTEFFGHLKLIDDWSTFDNARFAEIINVDRDMGSAITTDMVEEVTSDELALMADVKAILVDKEWFQVYDNLAKMTETYVGSGMYWNYFYNVWKTVSTSPFSNAIVFTEDVPEIVPTTLTITGKETSAEGTVYVFDVLDADDNSMDGVQFVQDGTLTAKAVAVHGYGAVIVPSTVDDLTLTLNLLYKGTAYNATLTLADGVGDTADISATE